jgi:hypothetical protein
VGQAQGFQLGAGSQRAPPGPLPGPHCLAHKKQVHALAYKGQVQAVQLLRPGWARPTLLLLLVLVLLRVVLLLLLLLLLLLYQHL